MRASRYLITTKKDSPADAEVVSHKLMLRAGMIKKVASGLYSWLPLGLKVHMELRDDIPYGRNVEFIRLIYLDQCAR